jgi:hypothetical protein
MERLERLETVAAIRQGLKDSEEGRWAVAKISLP